MISIFINTENRKDPNVTYITGYSPTFCIVAYDDKSGKKCMFVSSFEKDMYKGIKTYLELKDDDIDFPGGFPDNETELDIVLSATQMPTDIKGGESKFAYPYEQNFNFVIHNFDTGPTILGAKEPFHLIVCVRAGFPSKETIDDLIHSIMPFLVD